MKIDLVNKFDEIRAKLKRVSSTTSGGFTALCPAHNDHNPSLSASLAPDRILLKCHRGCSIEEICSALAVPVSDLFVNTDYRMAHDITYDYCDEDGELLYQVVRGSNKRFSIRRPDGGGWIYKMNDCRRVLFNTPKLAVAKLNSEGSPPKVFITEGEKDANRLNSLGELATTNVFGAGRWRQEYSEQLVGFDCCILPDNDDAGRGHAKAVSASLSGKAKSVRIVELPDVPDKGDVSDWLDAGHTIAELTELCNKKAEQAAAPQRSVGLALVTLLEFMAEPDVKVDYLVDGLMPMNGMSVVTGKPKAGKSTLIRNMIRSVALDQPFLGRKVTPGPVIYLALEEIRDQVKKQLRTMGLMEGPVHVCTRINDPENLLHDIMKAIHDYAPKLVVIDPMIRVVRAPDYNDYSKMAQAIEPLLELARQTGVHLCLAHHNNKQSLSGGEAVLGSTAIFGGVDTLVQVYTKDGLRYVRSDNRYGESIPSSVINFDRDTMLLTLGPTLGETKALDLESDILACLPPDRIIDRTELQKRSGANGKKFSEGIKKLVASGKVLRSGAGKAGNPYMYERADSPILPDLMD